MHSKAAALGMHSYTHITLPLSLSLLDAVFDAVLIPVVGHNTSVVNANEIVIYVKKD